MPSSRTFAFFQYVCNNLINRIYCSYDGDQLQSLCAGVSSFDQSAWHHDSNTQEVPYREFVKARTRTIRWFTHRYPHCHTHELNKFRHFQWNCMPCFWNHTISFLKKMSTKFVRRGNQTKVNGYLSRSVGYGDKDNKKCFLFMNLVAK